MDRDLHSTQPLPSAHADLRGHPTQNVYKIRAMPAMMGTYHTHGVVKVNLIFLPVHLHLANQVCIG
jgi:hypothetical protein